MVQITLTPELEEAISEQARERKTTTERLALDSLRDRFLPTSEMEPDVPERTLTDMVASHRRFVDRMRAKEPFVSVDLPSDE